MEAEEKKKVILEEMEILNKLVIDVEEFSKQKPLNNKTDLDRSIEIVRKIAGIVCQVNLINQINEQPKQPYNTGGYTGRTNP